MIKMLTAEELQKVTDLKQETAQYVTTLGELGFQEVLIGLDKARITELVKELKQKEIALLEELGTIYGDGVIDLETGEVLPK